MSWRNRGADFRAEPHSRGRGRAGEDAAARWLQAQGYTIVSRNATTKLGEIDVVAREGEVLCFIEVKARATATYGPAIEAVTPAKQRRLFRAAALWMVSHPHAGPCRFDVLGMDLHQDGWHFTLVKDAFGGS